MKHSSRRILTIAFGFLAMIAVICSQMFQDVAQKEIDKAKSEQTDTPQESNDQTYISLPSTNFLSSTHFELNRDVFFLFEVLILDKSETPQPDNHASIQLVKLFDILLGCFISPNAP